MAARGRGDPLLGLLLLAALLLLSAAPPQVACRMLREDREAHGDPFIVRVLRGEAPLFRAVAQCALVPRLGPVEPKVAFS